MENARLEESSHSIRVKYAATAGLIVAGFLLNCYLGLLTGEEGRFLVWGALAGLVGSFSVPAILCYALTLNRNSSAKARGWLIVGALIVAVPVMEIAKKLNS